MSGGTITNLVIGLAVLALLVVRQMSPRRLNDSYRLPLIIAVIGAFEFASYLKTHHGHQNEIVAAVAGSLVLAGLTGAMRTPTIRLWRQDGQLMRQGNWLTAVLWAVSLGAHLGYDRLVGGTAASTVGDATILLYLAVTFTVQRWILLARASRALPA